MTDANGALNVAYNAATNRLRIKVVEQAASTVTPATPDANGAWLGAIDAATGTLRVVIV